jgi:hypothetical protein
MGDTMKRIFISVIVLCGLMPLPSIAQKGIADPVTGNAAINFWGRVVDQNGAPIGGATVSLTLDYGWTTSPIHGGMKQTRQILKTDAGGNFAFTNVQGHGITINSIDQPGYQLSPTVSRSYRYSWSADIFHPNEKSPVVFRMWEKMGGEPLVADSKFYGVNPDGQPYTIDLLAHKKTAGTGVPGDIIVRIHRPKEIKPRSKFDWSYSIEVVDGGIIATNDDFMYRAPEAGYQDKYEFSMPASSTNWLPEIDHQQFYVKSRNGKVFGSLQVRVIPDYNDRSVFDVHYAANPSGSRNLER